MSWDGKGRHPILKMTIEEIRAHNVGTTERQIGKRTDSTVKTKQPSNEENLRHQMIRAQEIANAWINAMARSMAPQTQTSMFSEVHTESLS